MLASRCHCPGMARHLNRLARVEVRRLLLKANLAIAASECSNFQQHGSATLGSSYGTVPQRNQFQCPFYHGRIVFLFTRMNTYSRCGFSLSCSPVWAGPFSGSLWAKQSGMKSTLNTMSDHRIHIIGKKVWEWVHDSICYLNGMFENNLGFPIFIWHYPSRYCVVITFCFYYMLLWTE